MKILAIDTSCDETSISILEDDSVLVQEISSQLKAQRAWGGVVPMLAQRKHLERIEFVILKALQRTKQLRNIEIDKLLKKSAKSLIPNTVGEEMAQNLESKDYQTKLDKRRESYRSDVKSKPVLEMPLLTDLPNPGIDLIGVTMGPGLSIALEIGLQAAKLLAEAWGIPMTPVNHMEGHLFSGLIRNSNGKNKYLAAKNPGFQQLAYPIHALLLSGGHTELVRSRKYGEYEILGQTLDDAAGEAFDKFAVMLGLGYPGGSAVSYLAEEITKAAKKMQSQAISEYPLPVPMQKSQDLNFSYSGLKTAALYLLQKKVIEFGSDILPRHEVAKFCYSFEQAILKSIRLKLVKLLEQEQVSTLLTGGGVINNKPLRKMLVNLSKKYGFKLILSEAKYLTDNASMIGLIAYYNYLQKRNIFEQNFSKIDRDPTWEISEGLV
jgi:N6-L-threonylcarbamoyladenine synthase